MAKFRKKPVVIEAVQFRVDNQEEVARFVGRGSFHIDYAPVDLGEAVTYDQKSPVYLIISTLEGDMKAQIGDWIIKGVKGEIYPCKPDIFKATYEKVEE